jgi:hypothetical protein
VQAEIAVGKEVARARRAQPSQAKHP